MHLPPPSLCFNLLAVSACLLLTHCEKKSDTPPPTSGPKVEIRGDGLAYLPGEQKPYSGTTHTYSGPDRHLAHQVHYLDGQKNGFESRWFQDTPHQLRKQILWVRGEMAFHSEWWPNGQIQQMSSQCDGAKFGRENIAFGSYVKWFADGTIQFRAHYDSEFRWHGRVLDYNDAGTLMWDALFDHGSFVSGTRPAEAPPVPASNQPE